MADTILKPDSITDALANQMPPPGPAGMVPASPVAPVPAVSVAQAPALATTPAAATGLGAGVMPMPQGGPPPLFLATPEPPAGLVEQGNINLLDRPAVKNADGTVSSVRSASFNIDGKEVLVPTVSEDGRIMTDDEALAQYKKTGRHLGIFESSEAATAYAEKLHEQQAALTKPAEPTEVKSRGRATGTIKLTDEMIEKVLGDPALQAKIRAILDRVPEGTIDLTKAARKHQAEPK